MPAHIRFLDADIQLLGYLFVRPYHVLGSLYFSILWISEIPEFTVHNVSKFDPAINLQVADLAFDSTETPSCLRV